LNALTPKIIANKIAVPECNKKHKTYLYFRNSNWINFEKFGQFLGVDPNRLRPGFLDTWGEIETQYTRSSGIKHCNECLAKGYHNVFFELGFIDICPWHNKRLQV